MRAGRFESWSDLPSTVVGWPLLLGEVFGRYHLHHVVDDDEGEDGAHDDQDRAGVVVHLCDRPDLDVAKESQAQHDRHESDRTDGINDQSRQTGRTIVFSLQGITRV